MAEQKHQENPYHPEPPDTLEYAAYGLVYSMIEVGVDGSHPWWGQEFLRLRTMLTKAGYKMPGENTEYVDLDGNTVIIPLEDQK